MSKTTRQNISIVTIASLGMFAPAAFAYLDPSTGSMILSAIIGIFATLTLAIKTYWYKLKSFISGNKNSRASNSSNSSEEKDAG